jgi:hypothetical protein
MGRNIMNKTVLAGLGLLALVVGTAPASAQRPDLKLGLWETTHTGGGAGGMGLDLSQLPPEARAKIEAYRKAHPTDAAKAHVSRSCLTAEKRDRDPFDAAQDEEHCTRTVVTATKTLQEVKLDCPAPHERHGEMRMEVLSPESTKGAFSMTGVGPDGRASFAVKSEMTSHWISPDCGDVK